MENASYYNPTVYSLIFFIQDTFSSRDLWSVSHGNCHQILTKGLSKKEYLGGPKVQVTGENDRAWSVWSAKWNHLSREKPLWGKKKVESCCLICNRVYCPQLPHWSDLCTVLALQKLKVENMHAHLTLVSCWNVQACDKQTQSDTSIVTKFSSWWHAF